MTEIANVAREEMSFSESAVDGLFAGLLAGVVMSGFLAVTTLVRAGSLGDLFSRFNPGGAAYPWTGFLVHLAVSGVYGIVFGVLWKTGTRWLRIAPARMQSSIVGIIYGLLLWLAAQYILLPGSGSALRTMPVVQFLPAHALYGLMLGWWFGRT